MAVRRLLVEAHSSWMTGKNQQQPQKALSAGG
jgi:hypothetical protein